MRDDRATTLNDWSVSKLWQTTQRRRSDELVAPTRWDNADEPGLHTRMRELNRSRRQSCENGVRAEYDYRQGVWRSRLGRRGSRHRESHDAFSIQMKGHGTHPGPRSALSILLLVAEKANSVRRPRHCNPRSIVAGCEAGLVEASTGSSRLGDAERESLAMYAARATWPAGFVVYQRSSAADGVFVVSRGRIVLRSRVRAGRGFVPWIAAPGETFGSEGLCPSARYATDARADEESETLFLSSARFRAFVREQPQHSLTLIQQLMAERAALLDKLRELTTLSVEQRLIATLVRMANANTFTREDGRIVLCASRYRLLCELVGATRESVSLVLGRLTGEGLVERNGTTLIVSPSQLVDRLDAGVLENDLAFLAAGDTQEHALH
jgi:CRP/FNR family transcriptional regulator, cyclic AMP receptor protein